MLLTVKTFKNNLIACLLVLAVLAHGLIPAGFMPSFAPKAPLFALEICSSATGTATVYLPASIVPGQDRPAPDHTKTHENAEALCAFMASFYAGVAAYLLALVAEYIILPDVLSLQETQRVSRFLLTTYFPQGPPVYL